MPANMLHVLLVEDNPSDVDLTIEAMREATVANELHVVVDGVEAMGFLRRQGRWSGAARPDLVVLDLNLPRKDGREVIAEMRADDDLRRIPVAVFTTSRAETDILRSYDLGANCYIAKPIGFEDFLGVIRALESFWLTVVCLPPR